MPVESGSPVTGVTHLLPCVRPWRLHYPPADGEVMFVSDTKVSVSLPAMNQRQRCSRVTQKANGFNEAPTGLRRLSI